MSVLDHLVERAHGRSLGLEPYVQPAFVGRTSLPIEAEIDRPAPAARSAETMTPVSEPVHPPPASDRSTPPERPSLSPHWLPPEPPRKAAPEVQPPRGVPERTTVVVTERLHAPEVRPPAVSERETLRERVIVERLERIREIDVPVMSQAVVPPPPREPGREVKTSLPATRETKPPVEPVATVPIAVAPSSRPLVTPPPLATLQASPLRATASESPVSPAVPPPVPTTHVSIGRIVVSVEPPRPTVKARAATPPGPAMSLADYLASRRRGPP